MAGIFPGKLAQAAESIAIGLATAADAPLIADLAASIWPHGEAYLETYWEALLRSTDQKRDWRDWICAISICESSNFAARWSRIDLA